MQTAILAFMFGMLLFLMSAAVLVLEASSGASGVWRGALLLLAILHAAAGFLATGGVVACAQTRWNAVAGTVTAATLTAAIAAVVALHLAAQVHFAMSPDAAILVVVATLAAGAVGLIFVGLHVRRAAM